MPIISAAVVVIPIPRAIVGSHVERKYRLIRFMNCMVQSRSVPTARPSWKSVMIGTPSFFSSFTTNCVAGVMVTDGSTRFSHRPTLSRLFLRSVRNWSDSGRPTNISRPITSGTVPPK